ncbi:hypothetical protein D3C80_1852590 [compost metagenome]
MRSIICISRGVVIIDRVTTTNSKASWSDCNTFCAPAAENNTKANSPPWLSTPANCKRTELRKPKIRDSEYSTPDLIATNSTTPSNTSARWV